jgi:predicted RNase H-like HicB family nuclease
VIGAYVATAKQLPGVIPELITGKTLNEVNASIDTAKAAFARVAGQVGSGWLGGWWDK